MSTTWKTFKDEHNSDYELSVESGCRGIKFEVEYKDKYGHWQFMKFFLKPEDVDDFKLALDLAKQHT
jgi:hypothetical protein